MTDVYKLNELSTIDIYTLNTIYRELENIKLPNTFQKTGGQGHQIRTGTNKQKSSRQTIFGYTKYQGKKQLSKYTQLYPHIMNLFTKFIDSHYPNFKFTSVYVNKNVVCKRHLDSANIGNSILVGVGPYDGGQSLLHLKEEYIFTDISRYSIMFNGSEIEHESLPFQGTRYSFVFFNA
jgi:hypothetical protein